VIGALFGNEGQHVLRQTAMRIEEKDTIAARNVLRDDVPERTGLAGAADAEDGDVAQALIKGKRPQLRRACNTENRVRHRASRQKRVVEARGSSL
jgi:hypothetical protein